MDPYFYQSYKDYNYFLNIIKNIRLIKLTETEEQYLYFFVHNPHSSAYDIAPNKKITDDSGLNTKLNSNNYRSVRLIINKLHKLGLIKYDIKETLAHHHNKKFFSLTELGLFYLIRSRNSLRINIQAMIKNYSDLKLFEILLYPFIKLKTLCSPDLPINLLNQISLYIQNRYSQIENFISNTENKEDWDEEILIWDHEKWRKYLFDKYKYQWLHNAEFEEYYDRMSLKFFDNNKAKNYIDIRVRGDKTSGYVIIGPKNNKKEEIYANIKNFSTKFHFTKEESIGRAFSNLDTLMPSEFVFPLLSSFRSFNYETLVPFLKDEKFTQSLEIAKKNFNDIYLSIKNPLKYSKEARLAKEFMETFLYKEIKNSSV